MNLPNRKKIMQNNYNFHVKQRDNYALEVLV